MPKKTQQKVFTPGLEAAQNDLRKYLEASCYLVISHDGYWGRGDTIDQGGRNCAKQGASRSGSASVLLVLGDETAEINEAGYVIRDAGSHSITVIDKVRLGALISKPRTGSASKQQQPKGEHAHTCNQSERPKSS
jgi:hypothetical protein